MATRARLAELGRLSRLPEEHGSTSVAAGGLCWSHCQHDWTSILYDEPLAWTRKFLQYAAATVEILTHFDFYQRMQRLRDDVASR